MDKKTALRIVERIGEYKNRTHEQYIEAWQYLHDTRWAYALGGWFELTVKELLRTKTIKDNGVKGY